LTILILGANVVAKFQLELSKASAFWRYQL